MPIFPFFFFLPCSQLICIINRIPVPPYFCENASPLPYMESCAATAPCPVEDYLCAPHITGGPTTGNEEGFEGDPNPIGNHPRNCSQEFTWSPCRALRVPPPGATAAEMAALLSKSTGGCAWGVQTRTVKCGLYIGNTTIESDGCALPAPPSIRLCLLSPQVGSTACHRYEWDVSAFTACQVNGVNAENNITLCDQLGTRNRTVVCLNKTETLLNPSSDIVGLTSPLDDALEPTQLPLSGRHIVSDSFCANSGPKPTSWRPCSTMRCPRYSYKFDDWSDCSGDYPCGESISLLGLRCVNKPFENSVDLSLCSNAFSPIKMELENRIKLCGHSPCSAVYRWRLSKFGPCNAQCDGGIKTRTVECIDALGKVYNDSFCESTRAKPNITEECNITPCTANWIAGSASPCTAGCGVGIARRDVKCVGYNNTIMHESMCTGVQPDPVMACNTFACPRWYIGKWSSCRTIHINPLTGLSCGLGSRTRDVKCVSADGVNVPDQHCLGTKPPDETACVHSQCPYWSAPGDFGECSQGCALGYKKRQVVCVIPARRDMPEILVSDRSLKFLACNSTGIIPTERRPCNNFTCPLSNLAVTWKPSPGILHISEWSDCSTTCGAGIQRRTLACQESFARPGDIQHCTGADKIPLTRVCSNPDCLPATRVFSSWGQCSYECGTGWAYRSHLCLRHRLPSSSVQNEPLPAVLAPASSCPPLSEEIVTQCTRSTHDVCGDATNAYCLLAPGALGGTCRCHVGYSGPRCSISPSPVDMRVTSKGLVTAGQILSFDWEFTGDPGPIYYSFIDTGTII